MHVLHVCIHVGLVLLLQDTTATTKRTVGIKVSPEEVGHDAYLRHSHMTLVCNYAATRSKECHLRA